MVFKFVVLSEFEPSGFVPGSLFLFLYFVRRIGIPNYCFILGAVGRETKLVSPKIKPENMS